MTPSPSVSLSRWPWWRRWFGNRSERAAAKFLARSGLRILARNVADPQGELDLIAFDQSTGELVIVEVRSTASPDLHRPLDSVNFTKQKKLTEATLRYLPASDCSAASTSGSTSSRSAGRPKRLSRPATTSAAHSRPSADINSGIENRLAADERR